MWANWEIVAPTDRLLEHNRNLPEKKKDPSALPVAKKAFQCFEPYREEEVLELLQTIQLKRPQYAAMVEGALSAEQNAVVAVKAERYYRAMIKGGPGSWHIRDHHMEETLSRLLNFHGPGAKAIVWKHNTHIGDAKGNRYGNRGNGEYRPACKKGPPDK